MEKRFTEKIHFTTECWYWTAAKGKDGYGRFGVDGKKHLAHRVSFELFVGPIPKGWVVLHKCDNRGCVNPDHLEALPGRLGGRPNAKLTEEQVLEIRRRYAEGDVTQRALAAEYGVSECTIGLTVRGEIWARVGGERPKRGMRKGAAHVNAKLTDEQVLEIRRRHAAGGVTQRALAAEYGVSEYTISCIIRRKRWAHL